MTSPLKYLSRFITKVTRYRQLENARKRRRLLMESLEHRNLLAIDSLAAITGTVYLDGVVDTPVESAMVDLYLDDGDGVLERGVGVDRDGDPIDTATTNAAGEYGFEGLQAGTYFVEQRAIDNVLPNPAGSVQTVTISSLDAAGQQGITIDSFDETTQLVEFPVNTEVSESAVDVQPGEAVGGERDLVVVRTAGDGRVSFTANDLSLGYLELAARLAAVGQGTATWDGDDNDPNTLDPSGLGGIDLTEGGTNSAFRMAVGSDHPSVMLTLTIYTDAGNSSSTTFEVNDTGSATPDTANPALIEFDDLTVLDGAGADLTNVGAIVVEIDGVLDAQVGFDDLGMIGPTFFTADFTNFEPLSLGDSVWHDADNDGQQDAGEAGVAGVVVNLYEDTDDSGDLTVGDVSAGSEMTDGTGAFLFQDLYPGDYILQVDPVNFDSGGPLADYVSSGDSADAVDPDDDPSNSDDNGAPLVGQGVVTHAVTLLAGTEPTDDGDGDANTNLSVDFGFTPVSDLSVVKSDDPDPVVAGEDLTYTLVVTNNGPADDTGVVVTDTLPSGVTFKSAVVDERPSITPDHTAGEITAQVGDLASGETVTITVVVTVDSDVTTLLQNSAEVLGDNYDPNPQNNTSGADTDVETLIDLEIIKDDGLEDGVEFVYVGEDLVYTLVVTNNGPSDATGVTVSDPLPTGVTFVDHTTTQGTASESGGVVTVDLGDMAAGATATITITVNIDADAPAELSNTATVEGGGAEPEETLDNNSANALTDVNPLIDLAIQKNDDSDPVAVNGQLVYTLLVTNNGPSDATGVTVVDELTGPMSYASSTTSQGSIDVSDSTVTANLGDLASGATATVTITVDVASTAAGTLSNTAVVSGNEDETNEDNNEATEETAVSPRVDLAIVKADSPDPVVAGEQLTYTLSVENDGPSDATGVEVVDTLPAGVTFVSGSSTVGTVSHDSGVVTIDIGDVAAGGTVVVTILVDVDPSARGEITNTAEVSSNEEDTDSSNNTDDEPTAVEGNVDLLVTKTDSPDPVTAGDELTYTLTVTNNGPSDATLVELTDTLPSEVAYVSSGVSQGSASHSAGVVTAALGDLDVGETATVTILVTVDSETFGTISNEAEVTAAESEVNTTDNSTIEPTVVDELLSSLAGFVYIDLDNDGQMDEGELPLAGVSIQLVGTGPEGETIERQALTDENGTYLFDELRRGTYALTEIQPDRYLDGIDTLGTLSAATDVDDSFTEIDLPPGVDAVDYLFGERAPGFSKRRFLSSRQS